MRTVRTPVWPYLVLSVALLGALGFGWYQTRMASQLALDAENKYMAAFHKLKWTSEIMEERMALLMATNDLRMQESLLSDLRVFSAQAVENMAVLPFLTMETPRIQHFLNTIRKYSDEYHYKLASGAALETTEWENLMELRRQSVFFEAELSEVLGLVGNNMLRWRDTVQVTSPAENGKATTPITQSVVQLETALQAPPGEEQATAPEEGPLASPRIDPGPQVDLAAATEAVRRFVDMPLKGEPRFTGQSDPDGKLGQLSLYFLKAVKENGLLLNFGVSQHGGHVIYMLDGRPVTEKRLTKEQLVSKAEQMLERRGYPELKFISAVENDGTMVMDFAPMQQGVAIHVDRIKIMLAMDNGELVGFDARSYWINRHERDLPAPAIGPGEILKRVSPRLEVKETPSLALVADRRSREQLVWEVRGAVEDQRYRIFMDALTGIEVDVVRVLGDPAPPLNEGQ